MFAVARRASEVRLVADPALFVPLRKLVWGGAVPLLALTIALGWISRPGVETVALVFPERRLLAPKVRAFVDYMAAGMRAGLEAMLKAADQAEPARAAR